MLDGDDDDDSAVIAAVEPHRLRIQSKQLNLVARISY
jgi:hypothetical protein